MIRKKNNKYMLAYKRIFHKKTHTFPYLHANYTSNTNKESEYSYKDESSDDEEDKKTEESTKEDNIENIYGDEIVKYLVVRDEELKCFYVANNLESIYQMLKNGKRSFHEIILAGVAQKIRFDIDMPRNEIQEIHNEELFSTHEEVDPYTNQEYSKFVNKYMYTEEEQLLLGINQKFKNSNWTPAFIRAEFCVRQLMLTIAKIMPSVPIIKCTSHGANKFSYHIIVNAAAKNYEDAHHYSMLIYDAIPASYIRRFVDLAVYKSVQNLRMTYAYKYDRENEKMVRQKILSPMPSDVQNDFENWKMSLITHIDITCVILPPVHDKRSKQNPFDQPTEYTNISSLPIGFLQIIEPYSKGLIPNDVNGNLVIFRRTEPSMCLICDKVHDKDNSLMIIIHKDCYILKCRRNQYNQKIILDISSDILPKTTKGPRRSDTFINIRK